jgi:3-oxoacyl-[acyl-carrier-protein] synthase II
MEMNRVVITGMGAVSPYGVGTKSLISSLYAGKSGISFVPEMTEIGGLRSHVAGLVKGVDSKKIPRKVRRSMSDLSVYATLAAMEALNQGMIDPAVHAQGRIGVAIGSTIGSIQTMASFFKDFFTDMSLERMRSTLFFKAMNHSSAANVCQALGITGRAIAPSAACSTGCQALGLGFEMVGFGRQDQMLCGGTDEFHPLFTGAFDVMNAASIHYNDKPQDTPRPFDQKRDGVVCSEGCGILLLESLDAAQKRGARIFAELVGFATVSDPSSIANPDAESIANCMKLALENARLKPEQIDCINAHATATIEGDIAESEAIYSLFGSQTPVSSLKGHMGHTMAASGALETIAAIAMMHHNKMLPTLNLKKVDKTCNQIRHVKKNEPMQIQRILKNNFALGGVNSTIVLQRYDDDKSGNH